MARITDITFSFSGEVTYSDQSHAPIEFYYDSKAGVYTVDQNQSIDTGEQIRVDATWYDRIRDFFMEAFTQIRLRYSGAPDVQKTITNATFHLRGMAALADNSKLPLSVTYTKVGSVSHGESWDALYDLENYNIYVTIRDAIREILADADFDFV